MLVLPEIAYKAVLNYSEIIKDKLSVTPKFEDDSVTFASYDSELQFLFVKYGDNSIVKMTFNDIKETYQIYTIKYFENDITKKASIDYYKKLKHSLSKNTDEIKNIVHEVMKQSLELWNLNFSEKLWNDL